MTIIMLYFVWVKNFLLLSGIFKLMKTRKIWFKVLIFKNFVRNRVFRVSPNWKFCLRSHRTPTWIALPHLIYIFQKTTRFILMYVYLPVLVSVTLTIVLSRSSHIISSQSFFFVLISLPGTVLTNIHVALTKIQNHIGTRGYCLFILDDGQTYGN